MNIFMGIPGIVTFGLTIVVIVLIVFGIRSIKRRRYLRALIDLVIIVVAFLYRDVIIERKLILDHYYFDRAITLDGVVEYFFHEYHRYPMSLNEMIERTAELKESYHRVLQTQKYYPWEWGLHLVKWPPLGIKTYLDDIKNPRVDKVLTAPLGIRTYLNDTILYCVSYSYGFDNDDDSLKIVYKYYELYGAKRLKNALYMISPVPLNGDIFLGWDVRSVNDYRLDTTFVRQLYELQGDTLTLEEYQEWMKKREEFKRKEFGLE